VLFCLLDLKTVPIGTLFTPAKATSIPKPAVPTINGKETSHSLHFPSSMVGPQRSTGGVIANSGGKTDSPIASQ